jgi:5-formyltetrahydrofolate cyclo-ligase
MEAGTAMPRDSNESDELRALRERAKRQIRTRMRALRAALPKAALAARSRAVCARVASLPLFERAGSVALFWQIAERGEVDLRELDAALRQTKKRIYYPFMQPSGDVIRTGFRLVTDIADLVDRGRGFCEPALAAPEAQPGALELVLVPALALASDGHRIGYGAGFYDATLPEHCPPARSIVVGFDFQLLAELPVDEGDIACDIVVTDQRVIDAAGVLDRRSEPAPRDPPASG